MKKRVLPILLTLTLLLSCLPGRILGAEESENVTTQTFVYVNPVYADYYTEEDALAELSMLPAPADLDEPLSCDTEDQIVEAIRNGMEDRETTVSIQNIRTTEFAQQDVLDFVDLALEETGKPTQGDYLRWGFKSVGCTYSWYVKGGQYTYILTYTFVYYTDSVQEAEVTDMVQNILDGFGFTEYTTDFEKVQTIYDYICDHVEYDYDNLDDEDYTLKFTAYAALTDGKAVCEGYAVLLYRMLMEEGISTRLISGIGNGGAHGWNIVKLGDVYYDVDATWDTSWKSAGYAYAYFLKSESNFTDHVRDDKYKTEEFQAAYPMAEADYVFVDGDINGDGSVDTNDLVRMMKRLEIQDGSWVMDLNGDSQVDHNDLIRLMKHLADPSVNLG
jgi:transglutaminase-like putative cysteine protease